MKNLILNVEYIRYYFVYYFIVLLFIVTVDYYLLLLLLQFVLLLMFFFVILLIILNEYQLRINLTTSLHSNFKKWLLILMLRDSGRYIAVSWR